MNMLLWALLSSPVLVAVLILNVPRLRRWMISDRLFNFIQSRQLLPKISETEKAAIEAGNVWIEGEFFSGKPDFNRIFSEFYPSLTPEQQAFLDGPVEEVCQMATDWEIFQRKDFPPEVWRYLKEAGFFGMMIPPEYGGLGFSNTAYSAVMTKLASRSFTYTATVGVTNSLGPAKLLLHYGTPEQKNHYLPRLARGEEIPCFSLTEPKAGSDAASITSSGIVFEKDGELYLRLNWKKRYTTLGSVSTLIGLAFRLRDPDNLLGKGEDVGITCALVPTNTPGVMAGRRHDPMGVPFYNSPMEGRDVVLPIGQIIGGVEQAGQGWKMLMQCLSAGRGISFPATCTGVAKLTTRVTGAYSTIRHQFGLPIGRFEGVEEPLARIGGLTYLIEAARLSTCGAVDKGEQPAVIAAIAKYHFTELSRKIITDGMDILGGAGISRGPGNLLANIYIATPIPITVEGANILTRALIIFGQGAIRSHPYAYDEIKALTQKDFIHFDKTIWAHARFVVRNLVRAVVLSLTRGRFVPTTLSAKTARYAQKLAWASAWFALLTDYAMLTYGGSLKRHENITGRFADVLSWLYLGSATLMRFEKEGRPQEDLPFVEWSMTYAIAQIQQSFEGLLNNLPLPVIDRFIHTGLRLNPLSKPPSDKLAQRVAQLMQQPDARERLTTGIYIPQDPEQALGRLENAYQVTQQAMPIFKQLKAAVKSGQLPKALAQEPIDVLIEAGLRAGLIDGAESNIAYAAEVARVDAIQVDSFSLEDYQNIGHSSHSVLSHSNPNASKRLSEQDYSLA